MKFGDLSSYLEIIAGLNFAYAIVESFRYQLYELLKKSKDYNNLISELKDSRSRLTLKWNYLKSHLSSQKSINKEHELRIENKINYLKKKVKPFLQNQVKLEKRMIMLF